MSLEGKDTTLDCTATENQTQKRLSKLSWNKNGANIASYSRV